MEFFICNSVVESLFYINFVLVFLSLSSIGFLGLNYIQILLYIEVAFLAVNLIYVYSSALLDDVSSQIFVIFILSVTAAESAIALSIFIIFYRINGNLLVF